MTYKEIQELIRQVSKSDLAEVKVRDGESEVTIRTKHFSAKNNGGSVVYPQMSISQPAAMPQPVQQTAPQSGDLSKQAENAADSGLKEIRSPMVGTFYRSSGPDKPSFVKPGDSVSSGSVVCIIEAMKLFNEIESEVTGTIVKIMVEDASPVEYDQVLFLVE